MEYFQRLLSWFFAGVSQRLVEVLLRAFLAPRRTDRQLYHCTEQSAQNKDNHGVCSIFSVSYNCSSFSRSVGSLLEGTASYTGQLLDPAEGAGLHHKRDIWMF